MLEEKIASSSDKFERSTAPNTVSQNEVRWLPLASGNFLALQRDYLAAVARGVAILLPEPGTLPTATSGIEQLRVGLNDYGWTTISLMPPNMTGQQQDDNQKSATPSYSQQLIARLISAQKASDVIGGKLIVIAQGSQASYLSKAYLDKSVAMPDALILLDARVAFAPSSAQATKPADADAILSSQISELPLKVLDIFSLQNNLTRQMAHRKKLSIKNKQYSYRQSELFDSNINHQLVKTVYGWLKSSGLN